MLEQLLQWDYQTFELINQSLTSAWLDQLMPLLRNKIIWAPLYLAIISFFVLNYRMQGFVLILLGIITIVISDQLSSHIIKPLIERPRPCQMQEMVDSIRVLINCGPGKSFTSSHATNHFALAIFLINLFQRKFKWIAPVFLIWASLVSYAQIYVGVHFPLDVICGAILGSLIGFITTWLFKSFAKFEP